MKFMILWSHITSCPGTNCDLQVTSWPCCFKVCRSLHLPDSSFIGLQIFLQLLITFCIFSPGNGIINTMTCVAVVNGKREYLSLRKELLKAFETGSDNGYKLKHKMVHKTLIGGRNIEGECSIHWRNSI